MPSATGDAKTLSSENILDLRGLLDAEPLRIIDVQGREWPIAADLPLRTALVLLQHAQKWESGEMDSASFEATVDGMWAILRRLTPAVTRDDVLDGYSVQDMVRVISWLSLTMRARAQAPNGTEPTPAAGEQAETPRPKASRRASGAAN